MRSVPKISAALVAACLLMAACDAPRRAPVVEVEHLAQWALDPTAPGSDVPAAGRSLFDFAMFNNGMLDFARGGRIAGETPYDIPPAFDALVQRLELRLGCKEACNRQVLIPLGRSLQRTAAAPGFFSSPRVIVAITGEGDGSIAARDRIYLGYQRRAGVIEVISYNETAARFEFQLITDYRPGATPRVVYAKRSVCVACHQNQGPIFSRQVWDETNANVRVAARLTDANPSFQRVPIETPNAIDDAVARANLVGPTQRLWINACDADCRRFALLAALQYRLSDSGGFEREPVTRALADGMRAQFADGLAIPNPGIPNRDPMDFPAGTSGRAQAHVAGPLEALVPRAPLEVWRADDPELAHRFVTGLARMFADADIRAIDERLTANTGAPRRTLRASCTVAQGDVKRAYDCIGDIVMKGDADAIALLTVGDTEPMRHLNVTEAARKPGVFAFTPRSGKARVRLSNGNAVLRVTLRHRAGQGEAEVEVAEDFSALRENLAALTLPAGPINRTATMAMLDAALGTAPGARCCDDASALPLAQVQTQVATIGTLPAQAAGFQQPCGGCHATAEPVPPNFLAGDAQRIRQNLAHCAPRIYVRLAMWDMPAASRDKVPMPPPQAARAGHPWIQETPAEYIAPLRETVADWLRTETGHEPELANLLMHGYENLRPCLAAGT